MIVNIQKWGNSLAIRIPKAFAEELAWGQKTLVKESIVDGKLVVEAVKAPGYDLEQLLGEVTPYNLHSEAKTGPAVGNEVW